MNRPALLTTAEVLAYVKCSRPTLKRAVQKKQLIALRLGARHGWRFKPEEVERWLERKTT